MSHGKYKNFYSRAEAIPQLQKLLKGAEEIVTLSIHPGLVEDIEDELTAALDRDVLVLLLLGGEGVPDEDGDRTFPATVVRHWEPIDELLTTCVVDYYRGVVTDLRLDRPRGDEGRVLVFTDRFLGDAILTNTLANHWYNGHEVYRADPRPLPQEYDSFFYAIIDAAQHLQAGRDLHARVTATVVEESIEQTTVEGPVTNVRQSLVYPMTSAFPSENSLFVDTADGVVSVGGPSAAIEDTRAVKLELFEGELR